MNDPDSQFVPTALFHRLLHDLGHLALRFDRYAALAGLMQERGQPIDKYLTGVSHASQEMQQLLDTLSVWMMVSRGHDLHLNLSRVRPRHVHKMLGKIAERLRATDADHRDIRIEVHPLSAAALGSPEVRADEGLLALAFGNVLDNAARYSFAGTTVFVRVGADDPRTLSVRVENTGLLIHADEIGRCREWLWRGREAASTSGGLGLGLSAAEAVVRAHGGRLRVSSAGSERGALTSVELSLPAAAGRGGDEVSYS